MDKQYLQKIYMDFLSNKGYKHHLEINGDVAFEFNDIQLSIEIYDEDIEFGRLCLMIESNFNKAEIPNVYKTASLVTGRFKLAKVYFRDGEIGGKQFLIIAIGFFIKNVDDFSHNFDRMLNEIIRSYLEFVKTIKELN